MKQLPTKTIVRTQFKCDYCSRIYVRKSACIEHEDKCYKNPNRNCPTCDNTGTEFFDALGENLGVIPDADSRDCESCKIAEMLGGKSYIEHDKN
jgi:hypothetical protein